MTATPPTPVRAPAAGSPGVLVARPRGQRRAVGCADCEQPLPGPDAYTALRDHLDRCPTAPGRDITGMAHA